MKKHIFKDMVSQTRLEYGFNGYQVPVFPRASRSARVRVPIRKTSGNSRKCAFEILVSVAGELLQESRTSVPEDQRNANKNLVSKEQEDERQSLKFNISDQGTCDEKTFISYHQIDTLDKFSCAPDWFNSKAACANLKRFDQLAKVSDRNANPSAEFSEGKVKDAGTEPSIIQTVKSETPPLTGSLDVSQMDSKPPGFICSDSKASMFKDWITLGPSRPCGTIESVNRDDDKNHTGCTKAATTLKTFRLPLNTADRRIKNLSSSRHWGVSPNSHGGASFRNDGRTSHSRRRLKRMSSFKRSDGDNSSAAIRVGSSISSPHPHLGSLERNVKLRINSFKVPELLVEIPTTATVGSLKRTVMEAVTTALGDGLHVGILLQGKKVREDSKTLLQTGISRDGKHRNLGFMLEPGRQQIMPPPCLGEQRITRHVTSFTLEPGTFGVSGYVPPVSGCNNGGESDLHLVSSLPNISANTMTIDLLNSQSVLSMPSISVGALAVVPTHLRARRREFVQRRIRRPFSVSEVEALVQTVEKLGTGRWRDVKLHAFDNAKHRTYVDLKDKWKTLVHTARISPQQRRGEPLPQELLDRVLAVHAYWSQQQQAKQLPESGV